MNCKLSGPQTQQACNLKPRSAPKIDSRSAAWEVFQRKAICTLNKVPSWGNDPESRPAALFHHPLLWGSLLMVHVNRLSRGLNGGVGLATNVGVLPSSSCQDIRASN